MNELFDKLLLRFILTLLLCFIIFIYYIVHRLVHYRTWQSLFKKFDPAHNMAESLYFFSRIIGIGIIFSSNYFHLEHGLAFGLLAIFLHTFLQLILFVLATYIIQSVILYNFEYHDEIYRRKNMSYSTICFFVSLGTAIILKNIIILSNQSLIILLFLWSLSAVLFGIAAKLFRFISPLPVNQLIIQKNMALAYSFSGYAISVAIIIISAFNQEFTDIEHYSLQVTLKILLSIIILPLFYRGLIWGLNIQHDRNLLILSNSEQTETILHDTPAAYGLFEGVLLVTAALLTSVVTGHILLGDFYPIVWTN